MYFNDGKKEKLELLVSKPGSAGFFDYQIDPFDPKVAVYLTYSKLVEDMGSIQNLRTIVVPFSLAVKKSYGAVKMDIHNVESNDDLSNRLHSIVYVRKVLGAKSPKKVDKVYGSEEDTRIIRGLSIQAWLLIELLLSELRRSRIILRNHPPRTFDQRGPQNDDDYIDQGIGHMIIKVNSVINRILYSGDDRLYLLTE